MLDWSKGELYVRLTDLTDELCTAYNELGLTQAEEFSAKADSWLDPREDSVTGRVNQTKYAAAVQTISALELECRIKSLIEEKFLVLRLLERLGA